MDAIALGTPIASSEGVAAVNFFNGRLLTRSDFEREQDARRKSLARLGEALGPGIARGLEVRRVGSAKDLTVEVASGIAVNGRGQTLHLANAQTIALTSQASPVTSATGALFGACSTLSGTPYVAGDGLHLLTLAPAIQPFGKAEVLALEPGNVRCNTDVFLEGVQLRLLWIDPNYATPTGITLNTNVVAASAVSRLRNDAAYACFGYPRLSTAHEHPGAAAGPSLLETMHGYTLSDCDVPLALVFITESAGIVFVDRWAVRRSIAADNAAPLWSSFVGERIDAIADAELVQFQEHLQDIDTASLPAIKAADWFARLPPAGFLDAAGDRRVDWRTFFGTQAPAMTVPLAAGDARAVLADALGRDPVAVPGPTSFRVYEIAGASASQLMFVRNAPNTLHAGEVWLDGSRAGLPNAADVQTGFDVLRARTCRQLVLWPSADVHARIATLTPGEDVVVCFEPGMYRLGKPIKLEHLGHVIVHGAGGGSELHIDEGECALRVDACASLHVSNLALSSGGASARKDGSGLGIRGALTVFETPRVDIDRVTATCSEGPPASAACIVVSNDKVSERSHVHVSACTALAGAEQIGIQCVNTETAIVRDNVVAAAIGKTRLQRGIVVGGQKAIDVRIEDNLVRDVAQGISIGLSQHEEEKDSSKALRTDRVIVVGNSIDIVLKAEAERRRFAVAVGNAISVLVQGNRARFAGEKPPVEWTAVRLEGYYGRQVIVRDNHSTGATVGVEFTPRSDTGFALPNAGNCLWLFHFNVADDSKTAVKMSEAAAKIAVVEHNIPGP